MIQNKEQFDDIKKLLVDINTKNGRKEQFFITFSFSENFDKILLLVCLKEFNVIVKLSEHDNADEFIKLLELVRNGEKLLELPKS